MLDPATAFQVGKDEFAILEEITEQQPRGIGNDDSARLGDALQARGEIGRISEGRSFERCSGADEVARNHKPCVDADPDAQRAWRAGHCVEGGDGLYDRQSRTDGPFNVGFVRLRVTEIDQDTVTHVSGDEPLEPSYQAPDGAMKCLDDRSRVFGIESLPDCRRPNKVDEHHAKKPTFRRGRGSSDRPGRVGFRCARSTAIAAKPLVCRIAAAAGAALPWQRCPTVAAELLVIRDGGAATRAYHFEPQDL